MGLAVHESQRSKIIFRNLRHTTSLIYRWAGHEFPTLLVLAIFGSFISYIYSAPPLKLKQSGWSGNYALGSSYIALPWWAGQVLPIPLPLPPPHLPQFSTSRIHHPGSVLP